MNTPMTILVFGPEDDDAAREAINGGKYAAALWDIQQYLRRPALKGEHDWKSADDALDAIYQFVCDAIHDAGGID